MQATDLRRTVDLIEEARRTCLRTTEAMDELRRVTSEVQQTVSYFQWCRYLDYDSAAIDFLEKLDM